MGFLRLAKVQWLCFWQFVSYCKNTKKPCSWINSTWSESSKELDWDNFNLFYLRYIEILSAKLNFEILGEKWWRNMFEISFELCRPNYGEMVPWTSQWKRSRKGNILLNKHQPDNLFLDYTKLSCKLVLWPIIICG